MFACFDKRLLMLFFWYSEFSRDRIYSYENPHAPLYFAILGSATFYYSSILLVCILHYFHILLLLVSSWFYSVKKKRYIYIYILKIRNSDCPRA